MSGIFLLASVRSFPVVIFSFASFPSQPLQLRPARLCAEPAGSSRDFLKFIVFTLC